MSHVGSAGPDAPEVRDDVAVTLGRDRVAAVEIRRPPNNFFDVVLIRRLADVYQDLDAGGECRAIVLCAEGKHFCAGADLSGRVGDSSAEGPMALYREALRLMRAALPVVAAVQGAAVGGGLGLACTADFRVACPQSRFAANFAQLGFHHGFGLTVTLPAIVGQQHSLDLLYTGRRVGGEEAARMGLCDRLVPQSEVRSAARDLAGEIAASAPLAVRAIRRTMRADRVDRMPAAVEHEAAEQERLRETRDFAEGVRASAERRTPQFHGE